MEQRKWLWSFLSELLIKEKLDVPMGRNSCLISMIYVKDI